MQNNLPPQLNLQQLKTAIDQLKAGGLSTVQVQSFVDNYDRDSGGNFVLKQTSLKPVVEKPKSRLTTLMEENVTDVTKRTQAANAALDGTAPASVGEPAVVRGTQAAAEVAGGALDLAGNLLKGIFGSKTSFTDNENKPEFAKTKKEGGKSFADMIGFSPEPTPKFVEAVNKFTTDHPEAAKNLDSILKTFGATGEIAGTIAAADLAPTGAVRDLKNFVVKDSADAAKALATTTTDLTKTGQSDFITDLITPKLDKRATEAAIKTGKVTEGTGLNGSRDFTEALPGFDNVKASVEKVPGLSAKNTQLQNANLIHEEIGRQAESLEAAVKDKGFFSPKEFNGYMNGVKTELAENPLIVGDSEKIAEKILNKFNALVKEQGYTPEGLLKARKALDAWMIAQKGSKVFDAADNAITVALRSIRQGGNKFLAERVKDVDVLDMLAQQSNLYTAIENIAPKAAKEGENWWQRFIIKNPKKVKALKYGATAAGGGLIANEILK